MYMAKGAGKGRYQLFDAQVHDDMVGRAALEIRSGPGRGLRASCASSTSRWRTCAPGWWWAWRRSCAGSTRRSGFSPPGDFIRVAEESGDIDAIGSWVLETATREAAGWRRTMAHCARPVALGEPLGRPTHQCRQHGGHPTVPRRPGRPGRHAGAGGHRDGLGRRHNGGIAALTRLKSLGVRIAIDDFGTGFSSLSTLATLPVDILKVDRSFISGSVDTSPSVPHARRHSRAWPPNSRSTSIAEGIEQPDQLDLLCSLGCPIGQGFLLGRPVPRPGSRPSWPLVGRSGSASPPAERRAGRQSAASMSTQ